jgi:UDP-glucose 4-epimerase
MTLANPYSALPETAEMPVTAPIPGRILITGGRGRLANVIAENFSAGKAGVTLYSRNAGPGFADIGHLLEPAGLDGAGTLLHLAWSTLPATSEAGAGTEWKDDLPYLEKLLAALAAVSPGRRPHFIFFSSGGTVYGNAPGRPNREGDPCHPIGWYGRGKAAAEEIITRLSARHSLPATILRISNPYGYPVPAERVQGIIPHAVRCGREGKPLTIWGDGHARKDFLHYTDFLSALKFVITRRITGTFNLSAGESHSVHEIIALVEQRMGRKLQLQFTPGPAWDVTDSRLSPELLTSITGWRPQVSLEEGIRRAAAAT